VGICCGAVARCASYDVPENGKELSHFARAKRMTEEAEEGEEEEGSIHASLR